jgi:hypothetical protein
MPVTVGYTNLVTDMLGLVGWTSEFVVMDSLVSACGWFLWLATSQYGRAVVRLWILVAVPFSAISRAFGFHMLDGSTSGFGFLLSEQTKDARDKKSREEGGTPFLKTIHHVPYTIYHIP